MPWGEQGHSDEMMIMMSMLYRHVELDINRASSLKHRLRCSFTDPLS